MKEPMKTALRALLIAPEPQMIADVINRVKCISIREGHRDYVAGYPILIGCPKANWAVMVDCTYVCWSTLEEVPEGDLEADGFLTHTDALAQLQRFYPRMTLNSAVTVIRWACARGCLTGDM